MPADHPPDPQTTSTVHEEASAAPSTMPAPLSESQPTTRRMRSLKPFIDAMQDRGLSFRQMMPYAVLVGLVVYFGIAARDFFTIANASIIVRQSTILLVVSVGVTLAAISGNLDISVGNIVALSATIAAYLSVHQHSGFMWLAIVAGLGCGIANGLIVAYSRLPSFLVTLGTGFAFNGLALMLSQGASIPLQSPALSSAINNAPLLGIPNSAYWALGALLLAVFMAHWTKFGRHLYAIGGNERVAILSGLPVNRVKIISFALSGLIAAIGGLMLVARTGGAYKGMGDPFLLDTVSAVAMGGTSLFGGTGGPLRTVIGVLTITVLTNGMTLASVNPYWQFVVRGLILVAAVAVTTRQAELELSG
jgi:ribose/xylose/arabinose/galactoside ABC-type transport system permease subunit